MAKQRLYANVRNMLLRKVEECCVPKEAAKLELEAYRKVEKNIIKFVQQKYPVRDMKILNKYKCATTDDDVRIRFHNGVEKQFYFNDKHTPDDKLPLFPSNWDMRNIMFVIDDPQFYDDYNDWEDKKDELKTQTSQRIQAYKTLLYGSRYVEEVIAVWPECKDWIPVQYNVPVALASEQLALIQADMKERGVKIKEAA